MIVVSTTKKPASTSILVVTLAITAAVYAAVTWHNGQAWVGLLIMAASIALAYLLAKRSIAPSASIASTAAMVTIAVSTLFLSPIYLALCLTAVAMLLGRLMGLGRSLCRAERGDEDRSAYVRLIIASTFATIVTTVISFIEHASGQGGGNSAVVTMHYMAVALAFDSARRLAKMDSTSAD